MIALLTSTVDPSLWWLILQRGNNPLKAIDIALRLLEQPWFQHGYLLLGLGYGIGFAIQEVQLIRSVRYTNRRVADTDEYVRLIVHLARFGKHLPHSRSYTAAVTMILPMVWWLGRILYWFATAVPGGIRMRFMIGFAAWVLVSVTGLTTIILISPLVIGIGIYFETLARGVMALR